MIERGLCGCGCGGKTSLARQTDTKRGFVRGEPMRFIQGHTRSNLRHGAAGTREYRIWKGMRRRCRAATCSGYENYGGRGITVDPAWDDFVTFLRDMGQCPPEHEIDRIDNDGNYTKSNCRWALRTVQARNRRNNRIVTVFGSPITLSDACEGAKMGLRTALTRLRLGWNIHNALFMPLRSVTHTNHMKKGQPC